MITFLYSRKGILWGILHKAELYSKSKSNWNGRVKWLSFFVHVVVGFTCQTCRFYLSELVFTCFYLSIRKILIPPRSGAFLLFLILRSKINLSFYGNKENTDSERGRLGHPDCSRVGNGGCGTDCFCVVYDVGSTDYLWVEKINAW